MRLSRTAAFAACCALAHAFSDSTPFVLFSTAKLPGSSHQGQIQSSTQVLSSVRELLSSCPTERYLLVSQPNLNAAHLADEKATPRFRQSLGKASSQFSVAEVAGDIHLQELSSFINEACIGNNPTITGIELEPLTVAAGASALKKNDDELGLVLDQYDMEGSYTVIYTGGPRTEIPKTYTAKFQETTHIELKRQLHTVGRRAINGTSDLPLFEKYQYFTPAIFMGLVALVVLLSILYYGISALSSLEVSYGAFDKEMGPAAQKKQQ